MEELEFENIQKDLTIYIVRMFFLIVAAFHMFLMISNDNSSLTGVLAILGFILVYYKLKNRLPSILSRVEKSSSHLTFEYTGAAGLVMSLVIPLEGTIKLERSLITNRVSVANDTMKVRLPWPVSNAELSKIQEFIARNP